MRQTDERVFALARAGSGNVAAAEENTRRSSFSADASRATPAAPRTAEVGVWEAARDQLVPQFAKRVRRSPLRPGTAGST